MIHARHIGLQSLSCTSVLLFPRFTHWLPITVLQLRSSLIPHPQNLQQSGWRHNPLVIAQGDEASSILSDFYHLLHPRSTHWPPITVVHFHPFRNRSHNTLEQPTKAAWRHDPLVISSGRGSVEHLTHRFPVTVLIISDNHTSPARHICLQSQS